MIKDNEIKALPINHRYGSDKLGNIFNLKTFHKVGSRIDRHGYVRVSLCLDNRVNKSYMVHRLVAITHISNPLNKSCVNHINGIKTDNRVKNLEWCTHSENEYHAYATGLRTISEHHREVARALGKLKVGSKNAMSKSVVDTVTGQVFVSITEASVYYGIKNSLLRHMLRGTMKNKTNLKYYNI